MYVINYYAKIHILVFEISCLQDMIARRQTHKQGERQTDATEYMISRRSAARADN